MSEREAALEAALVDYVERYGLTDKARAAFVVLEKPPTKEGPGRSKTDGAGERQR